VAIKARAIRIALLLGFVAAVGVSALTPKPLSAAPMPSAVVDQSIVSSPQNNGLLNTILRHNITVHIVAVLNYKEPTASSTELW
jgi:hypothetical protein